MFVILGQVGSSVAYYIYKFWMFILSIPKRMRTFTAMIKQRTSPSTTTRTKKLPDITPKDDEVKLYEIPLAFPISITVGWMIMCSLLFVIWETQWKLFDAFYFTFVSLTTIGLGDMGKHKKCLDEGLTVAHFGL